MIIQIEGLKGYAKEFWLLDKYNEEPWKVLENNNKISYIVHL